tara:strand:- start:1231 stop:1563 length:333 start_codon:yes stop_codon:yes gene_type:complete
MRYQNKQSIIVSDELHSKTLVDRGVNFIEIQQIPNLIYPTPEQIAQLEIIGHTWTTGDRLYKLAHEYYGDSRLWWIISFFNKRPTEHHYSLGDTINIPLPLNRIMDYMGF